MVDKFTKIDKDFIKKNIKTFNNKRTVLLTGAGISVNSGIPDFRSKNGIFTEIKKRLGIKGTDLFSYRFSTEPETRPSYFKFISEMKQQIDKCEPSKTHKFINKFKENCKKFRVYTQNIDMLEESAGLFCQKNDCTEVVYLHGNLKFLICHVCGYKTDFTDKLNEKMMSGEDIECVSCVEIYKKKLKLGMRCNRIGYLCTNIIHYYQHHPDEYFISRLFMDDIKRINLFIVMGTSLKVYGVKDLVKKGLRACINNSGKSVYVGLEEPSKDFRELFDYFWQGDCDDFCSALEYELDIEHLNESIANISLIEDISRLSSKRSSINRSNSEDKLTKNNDTKDIQESKTLKCKLESFQNISTNSSYKSSDKLVDNEDSKNKKNSLHSNYKCSSLNINESNLQKKPEDSKESQNVKKSETSKYAQNKKNKINTKIKRFNSEENILSHIEIKNTKGSILKDYDQNKNYELSYFRENQKDSDTENKNIEYFESNIKSLQSDESLKIQKDLSELKYSKCTLKDTKSNSSLYKTTCSEKLVNIKNKKGSHEFLKRDAIMNNEFNHVTLYNNNNLLVVTDNKNTIANKNNSKGDTVDKNIISLKTFDKKLENQEKGKYEKTKNNQILNNENDSFNESLVFNTTFSDQKMQKNNKSKENFCDFSSIIIKEESHYKIVKDTKDIIDKMEDICEIEPNQSSKMAFTVDNLNHKKLSNQVATEKNEEAVNQSFTPNERLNLTPKRKNRRKFKKSTKK